MEEQELEFYKQLGKKISSIRKEIQMTQAELAEKTGVQQQVIASYEIGRRRVPLSYLIQLSRALHVSPTVFLEEPEEEKKPGPSSRLKREFDRLQKLPKSKQVLVMDLIQNLAESS